MKKVAYYTGCLAALSAKELNTSTKALAPLRNPRPVPRDK